MKRSGHEVVGLAAAFAGHGENGRPSGASPQLHRSSHLFFDAAGVLDWELGLDRVRRPETGQVTVLGGVLSLFCRLQSALQFR